jgi:haloalkane dehalogenase
MMINQPTRKYIRLGNISTSFLDIGRGEAIVALHGIPTSSALFEPLLPFLNGYRLIAPDLLGQGHTEEPQAGSLGYEAYENHLRMFMETLPPEQFHLLIHDLGGVLGLEWASDNPGRVKAIIILSTTITGSLRVGMLYVANLLFGKSLLRWGMPRTLKRPKALDPSLIEEWAKPWSRRRILLGADHFASHHLRRIRSKLESIGVPVLAIWGQEDDLFPISHARRILKALPQAQMVTIKGCGHWSVLDAPEEVAGHIVKFLSVSIK